MKIRHTGNVGQESLVGLATR